MLLEPRKQLWEEGGGKSHLGAVQFRFKAAIPGTSASARASWPTTRRSSAGITVPRDAINATTMAAAHAAACGDTAGHSSTQCESNKVARQCTVGQVEWAYQARCHATARHQHGRCQGCHGQKNCLQ